MKKQKQIINPEWDQIFYQHDNNFTNHAFSLYLFTSRLYNDLSKRNTKDVLFMSREGQFLKKLFERYCDIKKELGQDVTKIQTHYFYGSRNSVMTASVKPLNKESFDMMLRFFKYFIKPRMFMYSIGFSNEQIEEVRQSFGKAVDKTCFNFKSSKTFKKLKQNEVFKKIYEENRSKQSTAFGEYMKTFNIDFQKDGITFVDIGYHGTMQDLIYKFYEEKIPMRGYFIKNRSLYHEFNSKVGLLGDNLNKKLFGSKINKYDTYNYEQILRADHGRCKGYAAEADGVTRPIIDTKHQDREIFDKYVKTLQDLIFDKFETITRKALTEDIDMESLCTVYFYYLVKNKTKADYQWILDMQDCHHDDFGYVGYPGKAFARWLRKVAFTVKDKMFLLNKSCYARRLKKNVIKNQK